MARSRDSEDKTDAGSKAAAKAEAAEKPAPLLLVGLRDIHRIGGSGIENLRLKAKEATLTIPGISVLKADSAEAAARQMQVAFPRARALHEAAKTVASTSEDLIRSAGFDIVPVPSNTLPNHYRIIHPEGSRGFRDENLARLAQVFLDSTGLSS